MRYKRLIVNLFSRNLMYKTRMFIWGITDCINFVVFPFLWLAIFNGRSEIGGFSRADIVSYYIIMALVSYVFSAHVSNLIRPDIIEGKLNSYLSRPMNYFGYILSSALSYRFLQFLFVIPMIAILYLLIPHYFILPQSIPLFILFMFSLCISFFLSFLIEYIIGLASFWFGAISAFSGLYSILNSVFSGKLAPLSFFPIFLQTTADFLPFKYLYYFPYQVYTGKITSMELVTGFGISLSWICVLIIITLIMWRRGLKKYDGAGM